MPWGYIRSLWNDRSYKLQMGLIWYEIGIYSALFKCESDTRATNHPALIISRNTSNRNLQIENLLIVVEGFRKLCLWGRNSCPTTLRARVLSFAPGHIRFLLKKWSYLPRKGLIGLTIWISNAPFKSQSDLRPPPPMRRVFPKYIEWKKKMGPSFYSK